MFTRIETKILALFVCSVVLWVALLGFFFYFVAARSLEAQVDDTLKTTATVLASQWDGSLLELLRPGMEGAPLYRSFSERMRLLQERTQVAGIYIAAPDRTHIVSTVKSMGIGQPLPRLDLLQAEMASASAGRVAASRLVRVDGHAYKSAIAPIYSGNRVTALLIVDMSPWYLSYLQSFRNSLLLFTGVALCFCVISARKISRSITRPISQMVQSVDEIGRARYEKPLEIRGSDELAHLADSIEAMRLNILHRDAQMKMMLSGIAHEIRNPLGGIELVAGILEREQLSAEHTEYVRKIQAEVQNLKNLLNEFLDFAKPRRMEYENLHVGTILSELQTVLGEEFREKAVQLSLDVHPEIGIIKADRARLKQALWNLYRNAFQAVPPGGRIQSSVSPNDHGVLIRISNSQSGRLDSENERRIFEPFFTTREKGIGLGLPLAKRIIEAHGGELSLLENETEHITFGIHLPAERTDRGIHA